MVSIPSRAHGDSEDLVSLGLPSSLSAILLRATLLTVQFETSNNNRRPTLVWKLLIDPSKLRLGGQGNSSGICGKIRKTSSRLSSQRVQMPNEGNPATCKRNFQICIVMTKELSWTRLVMSCLLEFEGNRRNLMGDMRVAKVVGTASER